MRYTLLEMVQHILAALDSDEVDSIDDTVESRDIAKIIQSVYYEMMILNPKPETEKYFELFNSTPAVSQTLLSFPITTVFLESFWYDVSSSGAPDYRKLKQITFDEMVDFLNQNRTLTSNVVTSEIEFDDRGPFTFKLRSNKQPEYFCSIKDQFILLDSFDISVDTQGYVDETKTRARGILYSVFSLSDSSVPNLNPSQFPLLLSKAKERAFVEKKQTVNEEARRATRRLEILENKRKRNIDTIEEIYKIKSRYGKN